MKLKKELGQNLLINKNDIDEFINFCSFKNIDNVLEIGPGNGALSTVIAPKVNKVVGIELDPQMANEINKLQITNYKLQIENFLDLNLRNLIEKEKINKIVGAIPYYISSPIIHKIIEEATLPLQSTYLITQKEFAIKVIGKTNKRSYFTNLIEKYGKINAGNTIKKESFNPIPKVDSMFFNIEITSYPQNILEVKNWEKFLHNVFATPRKKINKRFTSELLSKLAIDPNQRPENIELSKIINLQKETLETK